MRRGKLTLGQTLMPRTNGVQFASPGVRRLTSSFRGWSENAAYRAIWPPWIGRTSPANLQRALHDENIRTHNNSPRRIELRSASAAHHLLDVFSDHTASVHLANLNVDV